MDILESVGRRLRSARFSITKGWRMGIGPRSLSVGNMIAVFEGGAVPFILRAAEHVARAKYGVENKPDRTT